MDLLTGLERIAMTVRSAIVRPMSLVARVRVFLPAVALVWAVALACYGFVWAVDPYELRSARPSERLADHPYPADIVPRFTSVVANSGVDVVVIGASTAMGYTPTMMRAAFPGAQRPFNLAYACTDERDLGLILPRLERSTSLKRVIISLDSTLLANCGQYQSPLDARYYVRRWYDPVPEFSVQALKLSRRVLSGGDLDAPGWSPVRPDHVDLMTGMPPLTASPDGMAEVANHLTAARGRATAGGPFPCDDIPVLNQVLLPFIRRMAARGVTVDILSPPYSLAIYSEWTAVRNPFPGPPFPAAMALRRCALEATAGIPNVYFHAFDTDAQMTADLALYRDVAHIRDYETYEAILRHIEARDHTLTPSQWPAFEAQLKQEVDAFRL